MLKHSIPQQYVPLERRIAQLRVNLDLLMQTDIPVQTMWALGDGIAGLNAHIEDVFLTLATGDEVA